MPWKSKPRLTILRSPCVPLLRRPIRLFFPRRTPGSWFLMTNLPTPKAQNSSPGEQSQNSLAPADLEEVVRLYSLRNWVEQSYKQVKHALRWVGLGWVGHSIRYVVIRRCGVIGRW